MYVVALTGRMGSGKSEVLSLFSSYGVSTFSADSYVHELLKPGSAVYETIALTYSDLLRDDKSIDRSRLAKRVFSDEAALDWLESLIHPCVREAVTQWAETAEGAYGVVEIPLLTEDNRLAVIKRVCVVDASDDISLKRIQSRDQRDEATVNRMRSRQLSRDTLLDLADDLVFNDNSLEQLASQVETLHVWYSTQEA